MSQENVDLVEAALGAWNRGDIDGFCDHAADDVAWLEVSGRPENQGRERVGRQLMRQGLGSLFEAWDTYHLDTEQLHDLGDRVVAVVREVATGRASGVEIDGRWGYVITVENGEIVRIEAYRDPAQALREAGVREAAPKLPHP